MMQAGFTDPVADAQACFRAVLDAMARPGRVHEAGAGLSPPAPLDRATAAVLLTLADLDTPVWLDRQAEAAREWIAFHCGAPLAGDPAGCVFALSLALPDLASLPIGTHEAPESGATLVLQLQAIGSGSPYRLSGPGLREPALLRAEGLPPDFPALWQRNRAQFPRGVDIVLCAGDRLAALPRSVTVMEG